MYFQYILLEILFANIKQDIGLKKLSIPKDEFLYYEILNDVASDYWEIMNPTAVRKYY